MPQSALHSNMWRILGLPIKLLILDEVQKAKNVELGRGKRSSAIRALFFRSCIQVSGTFMHNQWSDILANLLLVKGHPFTSTLLFNKMFVENTYNNRFQSLTPDRILIMQKLLLAFVVARPGSVLDLPGIIVWKHDFNLGTYDSRLVTLLVKKFEKIVRCQKMGIFDDGGDNALNTLVKAQLRSLHPCLYTPTPEEQELLYVLGGVGDELFGEKLEEQMNEIEDVSRDKASGAAIDGDDPDDPDYDPDADKSDIDEEAGIYEEVSKTEDKDREAWLKRIADKNFELVSSRMLAFLLVYDTFRKAFPDEKIMVFSPYLKVLDLFAEVLIQKRKVESLRYDGTMGNEAREGVRIEFARSNPSIPILITAAAGGVGLNITTASCIIQDGPWWNHNNEKQAYCRGHRLGQTRVVKVVWLNASNSEVRHNPIIEVLNK